MKIGIQGIRGSYHDNVAKCYFGDSVSVQEFLSFDDLAISVSNNDSDFGVMAIENSIAGSIIPNYALIDTLNLNIVGEYFINIKTSKKHLIYSPQASQIRASSSKHDGYQNALNVANFLNKNV